MKRALAVVLLLCAAASEQRKEILRNQHVTVSSVELAPGESTPMHRHDRDVLSVFVTGGETKHIKDVGEKPERDKIAPGTVRFRNGGFSHARTNDGRGVFRAVVIEFAEPQGKTEGVGEKN